MKTYCALLYAGCPLFFGTAAGQFILLSRYDIREDAAKLQTEMNDLENQLKSAGDGGSNIAPEQVRGLEERLRSASARLHEIELTKRRGDVVSALLSLAGLVGSLFVLCSVLLIRRKKRGRFAPQR